MVEALEVTVAAAAAAGAMVVAAPLGVVGATEGVPEGAVEVVMGATTAGTTEGAVKAAASTEAEAKAPLACRLSKPLPTPPTGESWNRGGRSCPLLHILLTPAHLSFSDGSQQFCQ